MREHQLLVVAQSPVLRYGIRGIIEGHGAVRGVVEAGNALDAVASGAHPSLVIIQDALAGINGLLAARAIREYARGAHVIVLTDTVDDDRIVAAVGHGVDALLPAAIEPADFVQAIDELDEGERPLTQLVIGRPELAGRIFAAVRETADGQTIALVEAVPGFALNGREIAVLDGMIRGLSSREIGERLGVADYLVKHHVAMVLHKLSASDRTTALVSAARRGLIDLGAQLPPPPGPSADDFFTSAA